MIIYVSARQMNHNCLAQDISRLFEALVSAIQFDDINLLNRLHLPNVGLVYDKYRFYGVSLLKTPHSKISPRCEAKCSRKHASYSVFLFMGVPEGEEGPCQRRLADMPLITLCWGSYGEGSSGCMLIVTCRIP